MSELDACLLARFSGTEPSGQLRQWLEDGLGGVLLFAENITGPAQLRALTADLREHNPGLLIAVDEEGGAVTRVEARTGSSYPGNAALGAVDDTGLTRQVADSIGAMLAAGGVNLNLAPVADVDSNPANPIIGVRSFGADPARVAAHAAAFVNGIQASLVAACAKHFPGHGRAGADSHIALPVVDASLQQLRETDLVPFRAAIDAGARSVMTAHVVFPAVDEVPATLSTRFLTGLLREELGFAGVIITDALGMAAIGDSATRAGGAVRSFCAGADLLCLPAGWAAQRRARNALADAVSARVVPARRVAESAERVRALAAWARAEPVPAAGQQAGADAARRALIVDTARLPLASPPYVLDAGGQMSSLLADNACGLLGVLRERTPGVAGIRLAGPPAGADELGQLDALIAGGAGQPLVLAVRDAHRHRWQRKLIGRALARRPDTVVVGTGTAHDRDLARGSYIGTLGASRASLAAAADVLLGLDGPGQPGAGREHAGN